MAVMLDTMNQWAPGTAGRLTGSQFQEYFDASTCFVGKEPQKYLEKEDESPALYVRPSNEELSTATRSIIDAGNTPTIYLMVCEAIKARCRKERGVCDIGLYNSIMEHLGYTNGR